MNECKEVAVAASVVEAETFPAVFEWSQPCKSVAIAGSFNNWGTQIPLHEQEDAKGFFSITLMLPAGSHFFKYSVDGAWKYDPEVAFAPDEYGNLNNFINITPLRDAKTSEKLLQRPIRTIIRGHANELPRMNPLATQELLRIRSQTGGSSPVRSPSAARDARGTNAVRTGRASPRADMFFKPERSSSTPPVMDLRRRPQDTLDSEYGLKVVQSTGRLCQRGRSSTLTRSRSEESLTMVLSEENNASPTTKYNKYMGDVKSSTVLLAATTQHFGGDLVTHEHSTRAELGGHRSSVTVRSNGERVSHRGGKMIIFLVGLPGRGKTFIGHILARHLTWMGHQSKIFNTGEYRRRIIGSSLSREFFDPNHEGYAQIRSDIAKKCLGDAIEALENDDCDCAIYDGTNATVRMREFLREEVFKKYKWQVLYIESICEDANLLATSINEMKLNSEDYASNTLEEAIEDYNIRIRHYKSIYQPISDAEECSFIKIIDVGRQIFCNQVYGYLQSRIMFLMANLQLKPRPIWLSRHGESVYNTQKRIGGDSPLSPLGMQYAEQLDRFVNAFYPEDTELSVWTSTMLRTGMTVERIAQRGRTVVKWKQLDEIDAGICDGMTYEQVAQEMPEEYLARKNNKLFYRYPRGESYQDVIHRVEPVITELMRTDQPVLIVAHQAILRVLYAYLTNKSPHECPTLNIPLHVVIQLTPKAYKCEEVWHRPM